MMHWQFDRLLVGRLDQTRAPYQLRLPCIQTMLYIKIKSVPHLDARELEEANVVPA